MLLYKDFLRDLQFSRGCSDNTVSAYKRDLAYYEEFRKTRRPIQKFYYFLTQKKLSPRSQARIISCLRAYFKFLQSRGRPAADIKHLKLPKLQNKLPRPIRRKEFSALWEACKEKSRSLSIRNQLLLAFLYGLGCRVSELVSLNLQDFNETEAWINVTGKGNRQRLLPLTRGLYQLLRVYLRQSRPLIKKEKKSPSLFLNNKGRRPSRVDIWRWLKAWSLKAGLPDIKNPHSFRHGCATGLLEKGADLRSIQQLLGHLSIQTTQIYTSVSSERLKKTINHFHPLSSRLYAKKAK